MTHDETTDTLAFVRHWTGGTHTTLTMPKPRSGVGQPTALADLELIRRMAVRYGDDEIARVLNKLGRRTGKEKRWSQERVPTARRTHAIAGQTRATPDPEILSLGRAAKACRVSDTTIKRLVAAGLLRVEQLAPWAPWETAASTSTPNRSAASSSTSAERATWFCRASRRPPSPRSFDNRAHLRKAGTMSVSSRSRPTRSAGSR